MGNSNNTRWLQVKGDPSVRCFVFQQKRVESLFDQRIDHLLNISEQLLCIYGVFHLRIHFSSNQLTCWTYENPYHYQVFVGDEIFEPEFINNFNPVKLSIMTKVSKEKVRPILSEFKSLRFLDEAIYLRSGSINRVNGMLALSFSCDGTHYLDFEDFLSGYSFEMN